MFGPTAVGKTELLLELFKDRGEVINADSMQVYNRLDIGSAKPTEEYIKLIPHHLISIIEPKEQFSVADFVNRADKLVLDIYNRGKIPVISGGTAFYFKNFIFGLPELPSIDKEIRAGIQLKLEKEGISGLYNELFKVDPQGAKSINSGDTYRVTRALEVFTQTKRSILSYQVSKSPRDNYDFLIIGLTRPRDELYSRINRRVDIMFKEGLLEEFIGLYNSGLTPGDPGMKGIGYSEFFNYMLSGCWLLEDLKEDIRRNSRRYAKRQITFFNSFADVKWVNPDNKEELVRLVNEFL
ncbi:tRNA (adenosine(37)-N6)-dimethylallyltransferase MiaA [Thiospirochaeta perfilievii]|uniref:tRNA (adenosine(37)-N6)-dimethylallyltransferase MiaA n=1 Tax=Thiospirochaeta perfilievii TaxID=252967 RepID=UPI001FF0576D|nr:tRNA (adenosine(37)-N6)-dimethylallyltransferase MiaA [Thiospirochaeta perfilievii]